jgi:hypothetical protein
VHFGQAGIIQMVLRRATPCDPQRAFLPVAHLECLARKPTLPSYRRPEPGRDPIRLAAAVANAVFDATGVRLRRAPLTPSSRRTS